MSSLVKDKRKSSLPLVDIVSHCYAAELPQYAAMLVYQASSLVLHKPSCCKIRLSVCIWDDADEGLFDPITRKVVGQVKSWMEYRVRIACRIIHMTREEIGRRCIGRNRACLSAYADFVWFADIDQVFRDGILDRLVEMPWPDGASMIYPREIMIHRDWVTGDERTSSVDLDNPQPIDIDPTEFVAKPYRKAIGGVQIVRGNFAREHGYLNRDAKWLRPTKKPFGDFRDDVAYRRYCLKQGPIVAVDLPGLYRLRHTKTTYQKDKK